jgi:hypothetical protein
LKEALKKSAIDLKKTVKEEAEKKTAVQIKQVLKLSKENCKNYLT